MNRDEAASVLAIIAAPYPWDVADDQAEVWFQAALERCDHELGIEVAVRLAETMDRMPTPAAFNATATGIQRERYLAAKTEQAQAEGRLLDPGTPPPNRVKQAIADLRASMSATGTRGHWHGGPDACPVCGGINPDVLLRLDPQARDRILTIQAQRRSRRHADLRDLG